LDEFDKSDSYLFLSKKLKGKEKRGRKGKKKCMEASKGGINNTGGEIFFNTTKKRMKRAGILKVRDIDLYW
jgi:hypothetical protein